MFNTDSCILFKPQNVICIFLPKIWKVNHHQREIQYCPSKQNVSARKFLYFHRSECSNGGFMFRKRAAGKDEVWIPKAVFKTSPSSVALPSENKQLS